MVRPLPLALKAARDGVVAVGFLDKAHFRELLVALHQVARDHGHQDALFHDLGLLRIVVLDGLGVLVPADVDVFLDPFLGQLEFLVVVDAFLPAAGEFAHVHLLHAQAQILFQERRAHDGAADAHAHAAHAKVRLAAQRRHCKTGARKAQQLLAHVRRDAAVVRVLHVMAVDGEGGQALLVVRRQRRGQVHRAGALGAVEAPDGLGAQGIHVDGLAAVAPAGGDGDGQAHVLARELGVAVRRLGKAADGGVRDHALHGQAAGVLEFLADQLGNRRRHRHRLILQPLADAISAAVDGGTDADSGQIAVQLVFRRVLLECFHYD